MAELKSLVWRIDGIPAGVTTDDLKDYFEEAERTRIIIKTIVPSLDRPRHRQCATVEYRHSIGELDHVPRLRKEVRDELYIDRDFRGFTPLYWPKSGEYDADIIAVTGLAGHAIGSWSSSNGKMWLRDFIPDDMPTARVLTYGNTSRLTGPQLSVSTLRDLAGDLLTSLLGIHRKDDERPIIFIGHSLGGLLIKMAILQARDEREIRLPVRSIIFLGTPHRGMNIEALRTMIMDQPPEQLVGELAENSTTLKDLHNRFRIASSKMHILSVYETVPTPTVTFDNSQQRWLRNGPPVILVSFNSAIESRSNETTRSADVDHSKIAKITNRFQGSQYPIIRDIIRDSLVPKDQTNMLIDKELELLAIKENWTSQVRSKYEPNAMATSHWSTSKSDTVSHWLDSTETASNASLPATTTPTSIAETFSDTPQDSLAIRSTCAHPGDNVSTEAPGSGLSERSEAYASAHSGIVSSDILSEILEFVLEHQVDHSISEPGQLKSINSTLVQAIKLRDIQQIRTCLIADPTLLNLQDENFESALHVACSLGFENETRILIAAGANINAKNGHNHSPLSRAILAGHSQIAKMLLEKGADTTFVDAADQTLLHQACMKGMTGVVAAILATLPTLKPQEGGIPFLEMLDFTGVTALTWACGLGHTEVARMLLHAGAKPTMLSVGTDDRRCPTIACLPKSPGDGVKILQLLTDAGLDLYDLDWQGNTPLHNVSWVGRVDLAQPIIAALTVAGMIDKMLALANSSGRTPLFLAMAHDHADMCQLLLQHGADPSFMNETPGQHDFYGLTPFDFACEEGHTNSVRVMLGHGRDLGETRKGLFLAARAGHLETCKLLLAHKVDSNYSHDYWTTLYAAARFGHVEIVRVLLDHGARAWPTIDSATRFNFRTRGSDVQTQSMIISLLESKGIFQGNTFLSVLSAKIFGDLFG